MPKISFSKSVAIPAVIAVLGLVAMLISVGLVTVWKPSDQINASATTERAVVVTRPGVLSLADSKVTISATGAADAEVSIVIGRSADVIGWAAEQDWQEITGVKNSQTLTIESHKGTGKAAAQQASPLNSPMWLAKNSGKGSAKLEWDQTDGQYSAMVVTSAGSPKVTLQWSARFTNPYFVPLLTIGIILLILSVITWLILRIVAQREMARQKAELESETTDYSPTIVLGDEVAPSRRALREARERGEAAIKVGDKEFPTGLIPIVERVTPTETETEVHAEQSTPEVVEASEELAEVTEAETEIGAAEEPVVEEGAESEVVEAPSEELAAIAESVNQEPEIADLSDWGSVDESEVSAAEFAAEWTEVKPLETAEEAENETGSEN